MDNEIAEGLHLGTTLALSVAVAMFLVTMSGLVRNGYIFREREVQYSIDTQEQLLWKKLYLETDYSTGIANKRHYTDVDTTLKFIGEVYESYFWAVVITDENGIKHGYTNVNSMTTAQKNTIRLYIGNTDCVWHAYDSSPEAVNNLCTAVYESYSARLIENLSVRNRAYVYYWPFLNYLNDSSNIPTKFFDLDFVPSELGFQLYVIQ